MNFYTLIALSEFDARFDDATVRRPFVARRHDVGYQHHHNDVNPPSGPGDSETPEPEPTPPEPSPAAPPPPEPEPPGPSSEETAEWQDRHENDAPSQSLAESVWRARQAGREAEARSRDNPAMARVEQSGEERQQRQEEINNREANWRGDWQEWNRNRPAGPADLVEFGRLLADFERYGKDWDDGVIDQWTTDDGHDVQLIDGDGDGKADVTRVLLADGTVQYRYDSDGDGKADYVVVPGNGILTVHTDGDGDGAFDTVEVRDTAGNVLSHTVHSDTDGDGSVDQATATTPDGVRVHTDSDGDGTFDTLEVRDAEGNVLSHTVHADTDGDGSVDQATATTPDGVTVRTDSDRDGTFDQVEVRDAEGTVLSHTVHSDTDGDGDVDQVTATTPEGVTVRTDSDGDGAFDQVEVRDAEGNVLTRTVHADTDGDGAIDQATVTTPEGVTVHTDSDGNGAFDRVEVRDADGNVLSHTVHSDTDGDGSIDQATATTPEGVTVRTDGDGDGTFDTVEVRDAEGNILSHTVHADTDGDGSVDHATVTTPEGVRVHTDSDGDGAFDTVEVRDAEGNVLSHTVHADTDGDGSVDHATVTTPDGVRVHTDSDGDGTIDYVPEAGSASDAVELFALHDSGSKPPGRLTREQGTDNWYNASLLDDDSGINLVGPSYAVGENTIIADGTVTFDDGSEARVQTTYTRHPDGTITMQSRVINYYKDDAPGGGGGEVTYTVQADGTVKKQQDGHTYTVNDDDLADEVRNAAATGNVSSLSSVDQVTVLSGDDLAPDVTYTVESDGTVKKQQDGHTYTVNDDDLADEVRNAAATGDASSLSSVDSVVVMGPEGPVYNRPAGDNTLAPTDVGQTVGAELVTPVNADAAWTAHQPVIDQAIAILNEGGTPAQLDADAAEVARIATAWRGSGVAADDGGLDGRPF